MPVVSGAAPNFLLVPISTILGGLIAGAIVYSFAPEAEGHGTDEAIAAFHQRDGVIRRRIPLVKAIASAFTIGSGGSGGREGPTAQIAAGFGSFIADVFRLSVKDRRIAVAVGIGSGIGSIFKSPFGGAILSAEILYSGGDFEGETLLPAFVASPTGYVIFASVFGFTPIFGIAPTSIFTHPLQLIAYAVLGIVCGLIGRIFTTSFYSVKRLFGHLPAPRYLRPMLGAAVAGLIGIFFPQILGMGYGFLQYLVDGNLSSVSTNFFVLPLLLTLVLVVVLKIVAPSFTVGSGGSAGVFAPSLVIGGFTGAALWVVINTLLPGWIPLSAPLVIVGMMALFAGVGRAPIAVILMVSEMTGTLALLAPSMVAVILAYYVTGPKYTIYRSQVLRRSESGAHRGEYNVPLLTRIRVRDAMNPAVLSIAPQETVQRAYQTMLDKGFKGLPVVDSGKVVGIVALSDVLKVAREKMASTTIAEIMTKDPIVAYPEEPLLEVLNKLTNHDIGQLPVVTKNSGELVGIVTMTDAMRAYDKILEAMSAPSTR
jgi:CIC family chloride channel protein